MKIKNMLVPHYLIIGYYSKAIIGCCCGKRGRDNVLQEEPNATFKKVVFWKCPICNKKK